LTILIYYAIIYKYDDIRPHSDATLASSSAKSREKWLRLGEDESHKLIAKSIDYNLINKN